MEQAISIRSKMEFQSTLPGRGATVFAGRIEQIDLFQSTLPGRGATPCRSQRCCGERISIHAPREGSDLVTLRVHAAFGDFNPRSPGGERQLYRYGRG